MLRSLVATAGASLAVALVVGVAAVPVWLASGTGGGPDRVRRLDGDPTISGPPQLPYLVADTVRFPNGSSVRVGSGAWLTIGAGGTGVHRVGHRTQWYAWNGVRVAPRRTVEPGPPLDPVLSAAGRWTVAVAGPGSTTTRAALGLPADTTVLAVVWEDRGSTVLVDGIVVDRRRWWRCAVDGTPCGIALSRPQQALLPAAS